MASASGEASWAVHQCQPDREKPSARAASRLWLWITRTTWGRECGPSGPRDGPEATRADGRGGRTYCGGPHRGEAGHHLFLDVRRVGAGAEIQPLALREAVGSSRARYPPAANPGGGVEVSGRSRRGPDRQLPHSQHQVVLERVVVPARFSCPTGTGDVRHGGTRRQAATALVVQPEPCWSLCGLAGGWAYLARHRELLSLRRRSRLVPGPSQTRDSD